MGRTQLGTVRHWRFVSPSQKKSQPAKKFKTRKKKRSSWKRKKWCDFKTTCVDKDKIFSSSKSFLVCDFWEFLFWTSICCHRCRRRQQATAIYGPFDMVHMIWSTWYGPYDMVHMIWSYGWLKVHDISAAESTVRILSLSRFCPYFQLNPVRCPSAVRIMSEFPKKAVLNWICLSGRKRTKQRCPDLRCPCPPTTFLHL